MSTFVIAEIGINHNGDINIAKELIQIAKEAGCNAVKFQKRNPDLCVPESQKNIARETPWGRITYLEYKYHVEFGLEEYKEIDRYCKKIGMDWFASAWDLESRKFLHQFNLMYNKIASPMITCKDLLEEVAKERNYTFISTGMSNIKDIEKAVEIFSRAMCPFELMHCVSYYPVKNEDVNLKCIKTLRDSFHCKVGYSGHETGLAISYAAVALGATAIERHVTLDRSMWGTDQAASLEPNGLRLLVGGVRKIEQALGDGIKRITAEEEKKRMELRKNNE